MGLLEKAIAIAIKAHKGAVDKAGKPYIIHPLKVMWKMREVDEAMAAVLHDVVEDTDWTLDMLMMEGFPENVVEALDFLTRRNNEPYEMYILRVYKNRIATKVKIQDLLHNIDISRIPEPTERDIERIEKYMKHLEFLENLR